MFDSGAQPTSIEAGTAAWQNPQQTIAKLHPGCPLDAVAELLEASRPEPLRELLVSVGNDASSLLSVIAKSRPASLRTLHLHANEPLDLSLVRGHLRGFRSLILSGRIRTGTFDLPELRRFEWADPRGNQVEIGPGELSIQELRTTSTALSLQRFLSTVWTPFLEKIAVRDPTPLLQWSRLHQLSQLTIGVDLPRTRAIAAMLTQRNPQLMVRFGRV